MNTNGFIKVTGIFPRELIKAAYDLSLPIGMGWLHYEEGHVLTDEQADSLMKTHPMEPVEGCPSCIVNLDYVKGRACKFYIYKDSEGDLWIKKNWYDHTENQLNELLKRVGYHD